MLCDIIISCREMTGMQLVGVLIFFGALALAATLTLACAMVRELYVVHAVTEIAQREEPIWVLDSPSPTMRPSSPFEKTVSHSERRRARRAGAARIMHHKRANTAAYSPWSNGSCGYMCMLKLASRRPTRRAIKSLRKEASRIVEETYTQDGELAGIKMRLVVASANMSIEEYAAKTSGGMWASQCELEAAARSLGIGVRCVMGKSEMEIGNKEHMTKKNIVLKKNHWILENSYVTNKKKVAQKNMVKRGGMNSPAQHGDVEGSQEQEVVDPKKYMEHVLHVNPIQLPPQDQFNYAVFLDIHPYPQIVNAKIKIRGPLTIALLRETLSRMLRCRTV